MNANTNPYTPPEIDSSMDRPPFARLCVGMFWLTAILSVVVFAIASYMLYTNYVVVVVQMEGRLPPYVKAVNALAYTCSALLACSAFYWRKQFVKRGALTLVLSIALFFGGPLVLLRWLVPI